MGSSDQPPPPPPPQKPCADDDGTTNTKLKRVCYYYDPSISFVDYGETHAMVPHRVSMTHALINAYGLLDHMDVLSIAPATEEDLKLAHDENYLDFLRRLTPSGYNHDKQAAKKYKIGKLRDALRRCVSNDNPVIENLWDYCQRYAGGSVAAARALASGRYDIAINWSGGMHHACQDKAAGFCYVNDIVVAVKTLLAGGGRRCFRRVLYVDIDAHHGDAVEAAFAGDSRVMTVSFHQYGSDFFPGTGDAVEVHDDDDGAGVCPTLINVPLEQGTGDGLYHQLFGQIVDKVMGVFQPDAVVMQCGADSLAGDRLASLGLSVRGHAKCVRILRDYDVPLLLLGGGGYTINHVACCWCYETAVAIGKEMVIPDDIPQHGYQRYYRCQGYKLHYHKGDDCGDRVVGKNGPRTRETLDKVMKHLDRLSLELELMPRMQPGDDADQDDDALVAVDRLPRHEDPGERMHRLVGNRLLHEFFIELGKKLSAQEMGGSCNRHWQGDEDPIRRHVSARLAELLPEPGVQAQAPSPKGRRQKRPRRGYQS